MTLGTFTIDGDTHDVVGASLDYENDEVGGCICIVVEAMSDCGFGLMNIQVDSLSCEDDLDGMRLHASANGANFNDDSLGSDMTGSDSTSDLHQVVSFGSGFGIDEAIVDFRRFSDGRFRCDATLFYVDNDNADERRRATASFLVDARFRRAAAAEE
ncbi:MAG TPA: hypothetical protein P5081_04860 [Phycisphaerae bacterium]|nr:hypothetical protein [Phycisphaerae bacterium]HRW52194.1 hypothetical protein [Phycisphaerae bacterium]